MTAIQTDSVSVRRALRTPVPILVSPMLVPLVQKGGRAEIRQ
jgi:hypothetical protein